MYEKYDVTVVIMRHGQSGGLVPPELCAFFPSGCSAPLMTADGAMFYCGLEV